MDDFNKLVKYKTLHPSLGQRVRGLLSKAISWNNPRLYVTPYSYYPMNLSGNIAPERWDKTSGIRLGFDKNEAVYSIVSKIAKTCSYAPWGTYKIIDEKSYMEYKGMVNQPLSPETIGAVINKKNKALRRISGNKLDELLMYPNNEQSGSEYMENLIAYKLLTGDCYEWARLLKSGANAGKPYEFEALPSQFVQIEVDNSTYPLRITGYSIQAEKQVRFSPEEILHSKYFNPNFNFQGSHLYGFSPLQAGWLAMLQDNESRLAGMEIVKNRGVRGVLAIKNDAMKTQHMANEQAGKLEERWRQKNLENRGGIVLVPGQADWESIGLSMNDMKILEIGEYTLDDLCNIYGVSSVLFNSRTNSKYDNFEQARKDFIINSILPILNQLKDARNRKLSTDWGYKGTGIVVDYDIAGYIELQKDLAKQAEWLERSWWLTPNQRLSYMRELQNPDPLMDKIYIPNDLIPLDEANITFDGADN